MPKVIRCIACGISLAEPRGLCPSCGGEIEVSVQLTGVAALAQAGSLSAVAIEARGADSERIQYSARTGGRSDGSRLDRCVQVTVGPPVDVGTRGEDDIFPLVLAVLGATGTPPVIIPADDQRGEDRRVRHGDADITIQMVTGGPGTAFWNAVASGRGAVEADLETAASWVNDAIVLKSGLYSQDQKRDMLLALDMRHLGVLAHPAFVEAYIWKYGATDGYGFGGVWLVGPSHDRCIRPGGSRW
jgi:hypothetical protein